MRIWSAVVVYESVHVYVGLHAYYAAGPGVCARLVAIPHPYGTLHVVYT